MDYVTELLTTQLSGWLDAGVRMLPNVLAALFVVVLSHYGGRGGRHATRRLLARVGTTATVRQLFGQLAYIGALIGGVAIALSILQLDGAVASLLAGAGVVGLALGFAFQDIAANFISGVGLSFRRPFSVGDVVETNGTTGFVERIQLRSTEMRTADGRLVVIPNKDIFQKPLINHSHHELRRVDVSGGVSYADDLQTVADLVRDACEDISSRDESRDVEVFFTEFGASSINFVARFWVPYTSQKNLIAANSEAIVKIKSSFDDNDITIPFPIRTLDFGIRGGTELSDALPERMMEEAA